MNKNNLLKFNNHFCKHYVNETSVDESTTRVIVDILQASLQFVV